MNKEYKHGDSCTFQILFTSDIHGAFMDYSYSQDKETPVSGFSKIAAMMRLEKDRFDGETFMVDVGDIIQGNGTNALITCPTGMPDYRPYPLLKAFDALGYDMVCVGNHEFNFGFENLFKSFDGYNGIKLCGNVFDKDGHLMPGFQSYTIKTLKNGMRVAFVGMTTPNITIWDAENFRKAEYTATDAAIETEKVIKKIRNTEKPDVIVMLAHMHTDTELGTPGSGAEEIVKKSADNIDVFLGAHFHVEAGTRNNQLELCGKVKFAENLNSAKSYGRVLITATYDEDGWKVRKKTGLYEESDVKTDIISIANDPVVVSAVTDAHKSICDYMRKTVVGTLQGGPLVPEPEIPGTHESVLRPTPLIHLITTVMRKYVPDADIVATSPNDFSANCAEGKITMGKLAQICIYDSNTVYMLKMTGRQIIKWMEWSHMYFGRSVNGVADPGPAVDLRTDLTIPYGTWGERKVYLHDKFAGIDYQVDLTKPVGERIKVLQLSNGKQFNPNSEYTVAVGNYRANTNLLGNFKGGVFPSEGEPTATLLKMDVPSPKKNINLIDWVGEYIQSQPGGVIENKCENNWEFTHLDWDMYLREKAIGLIKTGQLSYDFRNPIKKSDLVF